MKHNGVELYQDDKGAVAVLYAPGYGAGWSTWNDERIAYDHRIVEMFINEPELFRTREKVEAFLEELGYHDSYGGAGPKLRITWIPPGEPFYIKEYDGSESIVTMERAIIFGDY